MIIVSGAAGFIGSCLIGHLNNAGYKDVIAVDEFSNPSKNKNLANKTYLAQLERFSLFEWIEKNHESIKFIFHIGARTDTTEFDYEIFEKLNVNYSKEVWKLATKYAIPLVYASSAATYGLGEHGYEDDESKIHLLKPLNPYGDSKNEFDKWVLAQDETPPFWYGLKFFNVYGANEYHKNRMASVIFHAFNQISKTGGMKLFRSHHPDFKDGEQLRDFVYVKDLVNVCLFLMEKMPASGIYNLGTGKARTFLDLVRNTFKAMDIPENISFIDTPADIRDKYQYFTEATMEKLIGAGYAKPFHSLEEGVEDYVKNYLSKQAYL
ncbi:MAG: ADP-glyceromanno-heptose 6-epimerase [Cytophagales bacterium]|nr:MAG: ADP-glyceromanno-heptose 6-epimerase [Cytophagales bacterium]